MSEDQGVPGTTANQEIKQGTTVFATTGETVGNIKEYNPQSNYLLVQGGWLFSDDAYIPLDAIESIGASGVHLKFSKDELLQQSWDQPPTGGAATATGAPGTATSGPNG